MFDSLTIQSHKGPYTASFSDETPASFGRSATGKTHVIVDQKVLGLHTERLKKLTDSPSVLCLESTEENKSLERFPSYVEHLVKNKVQRGDVLLAIGGGIIQDITCFLAATLLRGLDWDFLPTTLLAQTDSCIGSKSSINAAGAKNLLGTFTPPRSIQISTVFLKTLASAELQSGVGEMIKVHAIDGPESLAALEKDYNLLFTDPAVMLHYIRRSLLIKQKLIEKDEFDKGIRNILNYGHSFGHAIEATTYYAVPHGIAVTMGMSFANYVAMKLGRISEAKYAALKPLLDKNSRGFGEVEIPLDGFLQALAKDKKNTGSNLALILLDPEFRPVKTQVPNDEAFRQICSQYLQSQRGRE